MADGAIRDQLDGGFFRQATDVAWRQPYFQKTAADQARIALAYLDAAKLDPDSRFPRAARGALSYVLEQLGDPAHGFAAAQDAAGEGIAYYLWTLADLHAALGDHDGDECARLLGVSEAGNIPDDTYTGAATAKKNVLYQATPNNQVSEAAGTKFRAKLLQVRAQRPAPRKDQAAMAGAHGLLLTAFIHAGAELNEPRFKTAAQQMVAFIRDQLRSPDGSLRRVAGRSFAAAPDDYALVIEGLRAYDAATHDAAARTLADGFETQLNRQFYDAGSGRYFAAPTESNPALWARVHVPSPSAGELPAPESTVLMRLAPQDQKAPLIAGALAAEARDSADAPRGDLLLALRVFATAKK
jgi:uncharacterized protein YyaL (SSP411 family)